MEETFRRAQGRGQWLRTLQESRQLEGRAASRMIEASKNYVKRLARIYHVEPAEMIERVYGLRVEELISQRSQLHEVLRRLGCSDAAAYQLASAFV